MDSGSRSRPTEGWEWLTRFAAGARLPVHECPLVALSPLCGDLDRAADACSLNMGRGLWASKSRLPAVYCGNLQLEALAASGSA